MNKCKPYILMISILTLILVFSGCFSPWEKVPEVSDIEDAGITVLYTETFDNSVTLEFLKDIEGAVSYTLLGNIDQMKDLAGFEKSIQPGLPFASAIYKAVKQVSNKEAGSIIVPGEVKAIDDMQNITPASLPVIQPGDDNNDDFDEVQNAIPGKPAATRHGQEDDDYFISWVDQRPGEKEAIYLSYYAVQVRKNGYHPDFTCFNSSSSLNATYQHWLVYSDLSKTLLYSKTLNPRQVFIQNYLGVLNKVHRMSKLKAGSSYAAHSIYLALKWDTTPVYHITDEVFNGVVNIFTNKAVFVDFSASWCHYCVEFKPHFITVSQHFTTRPFIYVDTDRCPETKDTFGITGIPHICVLKNGSYYAKYTGARNADDFEEWCNLMIYDIEY
jgi:thiol-disulfide isomerase/thioredoxin